MLNKLFFMPDDHRPPEEIAARQEIQAALIEQMCPPEADIVDYSTEWLHRHTEHFRVAYNELSYDRPNFAKEWKVNHKEVLSLMREKMREIEER